MGKVAGKGWVICGALPSAGELCARRGWGEGLALPEGGTVELVESSRVLFVVLMPEEGVRGKFCQLFIVPLLQQVFNALCVWISLNGGREGPDGVRQCDWLGGADRGG